MERQRWIAVGHLALTIGLASITVVLLLWWARACAPSTTNSNGVAAQANVNNEFQAAQAPEPASARSETWSPAISRLVEPGEPLAAVRDAEISAAWDTTYPVTSFIPDARYTWPITTYGVTITFYDNSFYWEHGAVFTLTPQTEPELSPPLIGTAYFFQLYGVYENYPIPGGGDVSLGGNGVRIVMAYDADDIAGIEEANLEMYHYSSLVGWRREDTTVDLAAHRIAWTTKRLGSFRLGGYGARLFFPAVLRQVTQSP